MGKVSKLREIKVDMIKRKRKRRIKKHLMIGPKGLPKNTKENGKFALNIGAIQNMLPKEQRQVVWRQVNVTRKAENDERNKKESSTWIIRNVVWRIISRLRRQNVKMRI